MGFYDDAKTAESYIEMAKGYDGQKLIAELQKILPPQSSVLELGSGPGVDLDLLKKRSQATGSDSSQFFVERYNARNPKSRMIILDAITLLTDIQFDAIYSNKVLHHLNDDELVASFIRQKSVLHTTGLIMHSFWNGDSIDNHHGLLFHNRSIDRIAHLLNGHFTILRQEEYNEFEPDDSHWLLARKT